MVHCIMNCMQLSVWKLYFNFFYRSGSYPSEVVNSVEGQHVKTGSFDSSMYPSHGSKHSKHKVPHREK